MFRKSSAQKLFTPLIAISLASLFSNLCAQNITLNEGETKKETGNLEVNGALTLNGNTLLDIWGQLSLKNTSTIQATKGKNVILTGEIDFGSFASSRKLFDVTNSSEIQLIIQDASKSITLTNPSLLQTSSGTITLSLSGTSTLGTSANKINITTSNSASNHLQFNSSTTINVDNLESSGKRNILSFEGDVSSSDASILNIGNITAKSGENFIAKGLLSKIDTSSEISKKEGIKLNNTLFDTKATLKSDQIDTLMTNEHQAHIQTLTTTSISANTNSANYLNLNGGIINSGDILATGGGKNYISAQTLSSSNLEAQDSSSNTIILNAESSTKSSTLQTISANSGNNTLTLLQKTNLKITGGITNQNSGSNSFNLGGNSKLNLQGTDHTLNSLSTLADSNTSIEGKNANITSLSMSESSTLTLKNLTSTITNFGTIDENSTLIIDGLSKKATVSITQAFTQDNLTFGFGAKGSGYEAELTLASGDNSFKNITFLNSSTSGAKLLLQSGTTTITDFTRINQTKEIVFDLANNANLSLSKSLANYGKLTFDFQGTSNLTANISSELSATILINLNTSTSTATLIGNLTKNSKGVNTIDFQANSTSLKLQGTTNQISSIVGADTHSSELILDAANSAESIVEAKIFSALSGSALTLSLNGDTKHLAQFSFLSSENTLKALTLKASSSKLENNQIILESGLTTITDKTTLGASQGLYINLKPKTTLANNIANNSGNLAIAFRGKNESNSVFQSVFQGDIATSGANATSSLYISKDASGLITGNLTQGTDGANNIVFASNTQGQKNTLILQGATNQIKKISWEKLNPTLSILSLDGSKNNVNTSIQQHITGDTLLGGRLILDFASTLNNSATFELQSGGNQLKAITLHSNSQNNILSLNQGKTSIDDSLQINNNQSLSIKLNNDASLVFSNNFYNASVIGSDGGGLWFKFNGGKDKSNTLIGDITTGVGELQGLTTFTISDNSTAIIQGNISTTSASSTDVSFGDLGNFILQGQNNAITSISATTSGTFSLDGSGSTQGVSAEVKNAITGDNITLNFNGAQDKKAELKLHSGSNQIKALTLANSSNATSQNKLILSTGATDITDKISVAKNQAITFDLEDSTHLTLTNDLDNAGNVVFNFNNATLTSLLTTKADANTTLNLLGDGIMSKGIATKQDGESNIVFLSESMLTLQGESNSFTSVSATSSATLRLCGTSNAGVTASVENPITQSNITLSFGGTQNKKAELTLQSEENFLKAISLGDSSSIQNKLILSKGKTTIKESISIAHTQSLNLAFNTNSSLFTHSISNASPMGTQGGGLLIEFKSSKGQTNILSSTISTGGEEKGEDAMTTFALSTQSTAIIQGNILTKEGSTTNIAFPTSGTLKLQGEQNALTLITGASGILSLDSYNAKSNVFATVSSAIENNTIAINLNGTIAKEAKLTLSAGNNALKSITLGDDTNTASTNNHLILSQGLTNVLNSIVINQNQALRVDLGNSANFALSNNQSNGTLSNSGEFTLNFANGSSTLTGSITTNSNAKTFFNLEGEDSTAILVGALNTQGNGDFILNAKAKTSTFQYGNSSPTNPLEFTSGTHTINLFNSTLSWKKYNGTEYAETDIFTKGSALTQINFYDTSTLISCMQTSDGATLINLHNGSNANIQGDIITSGGITTLSFDSQENKTTLTLSGASKTFSISGGVGNIEFKGEKGIFDGVVQVSDRGTLELTSIKSGELKQALTNSAVANLTLQSGGTLILDKGITTQSLGVTTLTLNGSSTSQTLLLSNDNIATEKNAETNLVFNDSNSILLLKGSSNTLSSVSAKASHNIISLSEGEAHDKRVDKNTRRKLTINNLAKDSSPITFISQTTASNADTFVIEGSSKTRNTQKPTTHNLGIVVANGVKLSDVAKSGEILVASVKDTAGIDFNLTSEVVTGFTSATATLTTKKTDVNGEDKGTQGYQSYFIQSMQNFGVIAAEREITATAFMLNYDLYVANFNSLNKRMGDLRENPHSQGIWARVFNGALSNDFGLQTKTNYTTIQAGYDYAFGFEGANNYLGFALSYALSTSTSTHSFDVNSQKRSIDSIYSNAFEVALYNSYVSDEGWYNDTIAKFSYLLSDFKINNLNDSTSITNDTKNFALTFGDEVGYAFKLGESKEWGITPQLEMGFGYFNQSNFKQTLQDLGAYLQSSADSIFTLRTRIGSSFSYDFKTFSQKENFNASVYLGAFYEYDYISGGELRFKTDQIQESINQLSNLQSDGRVVLNVGTNMNIKENTRIYFDFEKSFVGKITTDYQVNFGVRYSFGESNGYSQTPLPQEEKAPLKIEDIKPL